MVFGHFLDRLENEIPYRLQFLLPFIQKWLESSKNLLLFTEKSFKSSKAFKFDTKKTQFQGFPQNCDINPAATYLPGTSPSKYCGHCKA